MTILFKSIPRKSYKHWRFSIGILIATFGSIAFAATVDKPKPIYKIRLNDTGITTCSNNTKHGLRCPVVSFPGQDAQYGRDKILNNNSDGVAGFSFTKISGTGKVLGVKATQWSCVKDNVTGLMWEIKTSDGGLHDMNWTYSRYEPNNKINGGNPGTQNGGKCSTPTGCDSYSYVKAVNQAGWCGYKDWRMPTAEELFGLTVLDRNPALDTTYFPYFPQANELILSSTLGQGEWLSFYFSAFYYTVNTSGQVWLVRGG